VAATAAAAVVAVDAVGEMMTERLLTDGNQAVLSVLH